MILAFVFTLGLTLGAWQAYVLGKTPRVGSTMASIDGG